MWIFLITTIGVISGLAIYQKLEARKLGPPPEVIGAVPAFALTGTDLTTVTLESLKGNPWIVDFIFTRCGGQCPLMTRNLFEVQGWLEKRGFDKVKLVSVTVDPENDTPEIMEQYGKNFKADPKRWLFLTGAREPIYRLITEGFKLGVEENKGKPVADMFVHSNKFVLVDGKGMIRGYYVLEEPGEFNRLKAALVHLSREKK